MEFDCLLTNPPYQDSSHPEKKNTLWRKWINFEKLIKKGGTVALHHPSSWMGSLPILKEFFLKDDGTIKNNVKFINRDECKRHYPGVGSFFSYYVYNKEPYENNTVIISKNIDDNISNTSCNLNECLIGVFPRDMSNIGISILKKCLSLEPLGIQNNTYCHGVKKKYWRFTQDETYIYPVRKNMKQTIYFNFPHPDQQGLKLLIPTTTKFRNMILTTDAPSQSFCYFNIHDGLDANIVKNNIDNMLFDYLNECFRYSNWNSVSLLRKLPSIPLDEIKNDNDIFNHVGLNVEEINHIRSIVTWR